MKAIFFGDAHLSNKTKKELDSLIEFMNSVLSEADYVFILGDMFEFYHGYDGFVYEWFLPFVKKLRELSEEGKKLFFFEGNHEFLLGSYFEKVSSCRTLRRLVNEFDGLRVYISHGDEVRLSPISYLLRSKFTLRLMDMLGPKLSWNIAMLSSFFLSNKKKRYNEGTLRLFREFAAKKFKEGFDVVILAHSHIPDIYEITEGEKRKLYLNTGDIIRNRTYVEYSTESGFALRKYP